MDDDLGFMVESFAELDEALEKHRMKMKDNLL